MSRPLVRCMVAGLLFVFVGGALLGGRARRAYAVPFVFNTVNDIYYQDFNGLASTGSNVTWADDTTISGWYGSRNRYQTSNGSSNQGDIYSFGSTGSTERSLGTIGSNGTDTIYYGVILQNNTGQSINYIAVNYYAEQWRDSNVAAQTVTFSYVIGTGLGAADLVSTTPTGVASVLDFTSTSNLNAGALNGNSVRQQIQSTISLAAPLNSGQQILLRWTDVNHTGNDHGFGIDDLSVKLSLAPTTVSWAGSSLQADRPLARPGDTLTYRLSLSDPEGGEFTVSDTFDPAVTVLSAPGMQISGRSVVAQGVLAPGARQTYTITVRVAADYTGDLSNRATIAGGAGERTLEAPPVSVRHPDARLFLPFLNR